MHLVNTFGFIYASSMHLLQRDLSQSKLMGLKCALNYLFLLSYNVPISHPHCTASLSLCQNHVVKTFSGGFLSMSAACFTPVGNVTISRCTLSAKCTLKFTYLLCNSNERRGGQLWGFSAQMIFKFWDQDQRYWKQSN